MKQLEHIYKAAVNKYQVTIQEVYVDGQLITEPFSVLIENTKKLIKDTASGIDTCITSVLKTNIKTAAEQLYNETIGGEDGIKAALAELTSPRTKTAVKQAGGYLTSVEIAYNALVADLTQVDKTGLTGFMNAVSTGADAIAALSFDLSDFISVEDLGESENRTAQGIVTQTMHFHPDHPEDNPCGESSPEESSGGSSSTETIEIPITVTTEEKENSSWFKQALQAIHVVSKDSDIREMYDAQADTIIKNAGGDKVFCNK